MDNIYGLLDGESSHDPEQRSRRLKVNWVSCETSVPCQIDAKLLWAVEWIHKRDNQI